MATVIEIVAEHIRQNGFGGLVQPDAECGCKLGDLVPCSSDFSQCRPGHVHHDPRPGKEDNWMVSTNFAAPSPEAFDRLD